MELAFASSGASCKNVEDELCAIDDLRVQCAFKVAELGWSEFVVEYNNVGGKALHQAFQFLHLAAANQRCGFEAFAILDYPFNDLSSRRFRERCQFVK